MSSSSEAKSLGIRKKLFFSAVVAGIAVVLAFGIAELFFRIVPIPGIAFHNFYYDDLTGCRFYPHSSMIYRNDRNEYAKRKVNSWGYLDTEHEEKKAPGVVRIGFFGDSYVQAQQFPIEDMFFRIVQNELNSAPRSSEIETIAFGVSGYSTFHSYLESRRWADSLDIDIVCYVFCENDVGDNVPLIKRSDEIPYAVLSGDTIRGDFSFRDRYNYKKGWRHRTWQYCKSRSLVCGALQSRLMLLRQRGIRLRATEADKKMSGVAKKGAIPTAVDLPSSWPDSLCAEAQEVTERVLVRWKRELDAAKRDFVVVYIPRQSEIAKPVAQQDSWAPWLFEVCARNDIELIDLSPRFAAAIEGGGEMYYDHLTKDGHRVLAEVFVDYYRSRPAMEP